ncbi:MAG: HAD family hydrolase [Anaerolineaceae bacterium]
MTLKAIFFDMGGTIETFQFTREYRIAKIHLIRECLEKAGIQPCVSDAQLADMITKGAITYLRWNLESNIELKPAEIWLKYFLTDLSVSSKALASIAEELAFIYETQLFSREFRPEIPRVLEEIKRMGLAIGCISNTQSHNQVPHNLKEYGIFDYFDPIVLSSVYGRRKPDPSIFYYAARLANAPTSSCAYIGDTINRDILGARRAGFHLAIQIVHSFKNGCEPDTGAVPDQVIQNMDELIPILEQEIKNDRRYRAISEKRKIKALFFDAGDILYFRPQKNQNFENFLKVRNISLQADFEAESKKLRDLAYSGQIKRYEYYKKILQLCGITSPKEIAEGVSAMSEDDNTVEIMNGVPETILKLKKEGYFLGIITDTALSISRKLQWFENYGFGHVWDIMISSREMGIRKPSPIMYQQAIAQTGICASEAIFVGHKKTELDGAKAVGMHTVAFNYEKDAVADVYIQDFPDLLKVPLLEN